MDAEYISIIDYAQSKSVTTQAVYKQLKTHQKALEGHIIERSGKRWLSPDAVKILDDASKTSSPVIVDTADKMKLEDAQARIRELEEQLQIAQGEAAAANKTIISLMQDKIEYIGIQERSKLLLEQKDMEVQKLQKRSLWKRIFNTV